MSTPRTPTRSGLYERSDSQPNLTYTDTQSEVDDNMKITVRNKRKQLDEGENLMLIQKNMSDLSKQMSQMMSMITSLTTNQNEFMDKISQDVKAIKEELSDIKDVTKKLSEEQNTVKIDICSLKTMHSETDSKIKVLESDIAQLKSATNSSTISSLETILTEINERKIRSKNIIIIGVPEQHLENSEARKEAEKKEILRITRIADPKCPEPEMITRLGKFDPKKTRPIKLSFKSQDIAISILRNSKNIKSDNVILFPDKTPQQQAYMKELKEELKQRIEDGEKDLVIRYIKGMPKITKPYSKN